MVTDSSCMAELFPKQRRNPFLESLPIVETTFHQQMQQCLDVPRSQQLTEVLLSELNLKVSTAESGRQKHRCDSTG